MGLSEAVIAALLVIASRATSPCERILRADAPAQTGQATYVGQAEPEPGHASEHPAIAGTWVVLGDSVTEKNFWAATSYYDYVCAELGCEVANFGLSGTGYMASGAYGTGAFWERAERLDLAGVGCLTVFGSLNDLGKGFELGAPTDETPYTIGGCMNLTMEALQAKRPDLPIGIVTPLPWRAGYGFLADGSVSPTATTPQECDAYVDLLLEVAGQHGLPVLDLYHSSPLDPNSEQDLALYYTSGYLQDECGAHPNSAGHELMSPLWREFVLGLVADAQGK